MHVSRGIVNVGKPFMLCGKIDSNTGLIEKVTDSTIEESVYELSVAHEKTEWFRCEGTPHFICERRDAKSAPRLYPNGSMIEYPGSTQFKKSSSRYPSQIYYFYRS